MKRSMNNDEFILKNERKVIKLDGNYILFLMSVFPEAAGAFL